MLDKYWKCVIDPSGVVQNQIFGVYPKITVSLKFLLFYTNPKGEKRNFTLVSVQKWDTPNFCRIIYLSLDKNSHTSHTKYGFDKQVN
jgi:hypothetical protein